MVICVDTGGTKTMVGAFDGSPSSEGLIREATFPTPKSQNEYLATVEGAIRELLGGEDLTKISMALPTTARDPMFFGVSGLEASGLPSRRADLVFANLPWVDFNPAEELYKMFNVPVCSANDGDLAALYEARVREFAGVLLALPLGTGIGSGLTIGRELDKVHPEAGHMVLNFDGELREWESFASGRAIVSEFGSADEVCDAAVWREVARRLSVGIAILIPVLRPDLIVINGGFGSHFAEFQGYLNAEIAGRLNERLFAVPPIETSRNPEKAVLLGCYHYAEQI